MAGILALVDRWGCRWIRAVVSPILQTAVWCDDLSMAPKHTVEGQSSATQSGQAIHRRRREPCRRRLLRVSIRRRRQTMTSHRLLHRSEEQAEGNKDGSSFFFLRSVSV